MNKSRMEIIEKIQKLLALANSDNENEAQVAAKRAQELLLKYNLKMADVELEEGEEKYAAEKFETGKARSTQEWKYIQSLLSEFYFIRIVHSKKRVINIQKDGSVKFGTEVVYALLGQSHNVVIAKFVRDFLHRSFVDLFKKYREQTGATASAKESFYLGLFKGLREQLLATKIKVEQETGLVVVEDAGLDEFMDDVFSGKLKSRAVAKVNIQDQAALIAGHEEGKNLKIARGLGGGTDDQKQVGQTLRLNGSK